MAGIYQQTIFGLKCQPAGLRVTPYISNPVVGQFGKKMKKSIVGKWDYPT